MVKKALIILPFGLLAVVLVSTAVFAKVISGNSPSIAAGEVVDDDVFLAGRNVTVSGTVNGDVYAAGTTVTISGVVNGDVIAAAQNIFINGQVRDDVRVAGQSVNLTDARIGDSVSVGANTFNAIRSPIGGGVLVGATDATINSRIGRGITGAGQTMSISRRVGNDVRVAVDQLTITQTARINGRVLYRSNNNAVVEQGASISGEIRRSAPPAWPDIDLFIPYRVWSFLAALVVGLLLLRIFPKPLTQMGTNITKRPWAMLGWGFVALVATIPAAVILMISVIGIPLGVITIGMFFLAAYISKIVAVFAGASAIWRRYKFKQKSPYLVMSVGLLAYYAVLFVPVLGSITRFAALLVGLGAISVYSSQLIGKSTKKR